MLKIIYIEDQRRQERNQEYKNIIHRLGFNDIISFCSEVSVDAISILSADGVICHSGMAGYEIVNYFAKDKGWPLLSYSGSVDSTPFLRENKFARNQYSVDSDYFDIVLPEFIELCKSIKKAEK
ncbi:hypothetical protein [Shewanella kaireitica]|uniref:hypothetical protein n=1 Tax=Shewanella kaireitica TaxID=212021 RepID=UPI00200CFA26|nr:hypothetical protein [Shewanella kaireitica]MCL1093664.1 hypothetical protein [Shewanella kaireitica]